MERKLSLFDSIVEACEQFNYYSKAGNTQLCNIALDCGSEAEDLLSRVNIVVGCSTKGGLFNKVVFYIEVNGKRTLLEEREIEI